MAASKVLKPGDDFFTAGDHLGTPCMEPASRRYINGAWYITFKEDNLSLFPGRVRDRDGREERLCIGVKRPFK